ncbi:MAG: rane-bound lytic murein transglycosylase [Candidatus Binatota bacterium]|nr:rane-bound lytic murein transglycosylase [Candidatus Binatota bacterium]
MSIKSTINHALRRFIVLLFLLRLGAAETPVEAQQTPFPIPSGLEETVEFWKHVFTRYGANQIVLFDPMDPGKIYSVVSAADGSAIDRERAKIVADYNLADDENRIRTQRGAKEHFLEGLKISGRYIGQMQKIFREEGLPPDLAYLPLVESSFNIRARSSVGAVGMWQFMPETGKKFLRIDTAVDERLDPIASTRAAARLLKENYRILGRWPLAITAYNHGTDGIFRGIKAVESDDLVDLIRRYESPTFGFASKNFYAEFLAVVDIATNNEQYFPHLRTHRPVILQEVAVKRSAKLQALLKPAAISQRDFLDWNPALDPAAQSIPLGYRVKLRPDKVDDFLAAHTRAGAPSHAKKVSMVRTVVLQKAVARSQRQATATIARTPTPKMALAAANATGRVSSPATKRAATSRTQLKLAAR